MKKNSTKHNVAGINLEIDEYKREIDKIESEFKLKNMYCYKSNPETRKLSLY
jgi:hypothetical protein